MKCANMNCEQVNRKCRPEYCSDDKNGASKSWGYCNMLHWKHIELSPNYTKIKQNCLKEPKYKTHNTKKNKRTISVDAEMLHHKMPYIWRFLKPTTRRKMIELAKKEVDEINIPFMVFTKKRNPTKLIKQYRQKYKDI